MKIWGFVAVAGAALFLASCATVSREQCEAGDWPAIGKAHALQGFPASRLDNVVEDCGRHSIAVDTDAYMQGWRMGVRAYCTPRRGFEDGRNGKRPSFSCPADLAVDYDDARRLGGRLKEAEADVSLSESSLERSQREVDDAQQARREGRVALQQRLEQDRTCSRPAPELAVGSGPRDSPGGAQRAQLFGPQPLAERQRLGIRQGRQQRDGLGRAPQALVGGREGQAHLLVSGRQGALQAANRSIHALRIDARGVRARREASRESSLGSLNLPPRSSVLVSEALTLSQAAITVTGRKGALRWVSTCWRNS